MKIPSKGRAKIYEDINRLEITIPAARIWIAIIFLSFWMGGWLFGEVTVIGILWKQDTPLFANAFLLFWLLCWTLGGAFVIFVIANMIAGKEIISLERGELRIYRGVFGLGRRRTFDCGEIKNLQLNPEMYGRPMLTQMRSIYKFNSGTMKFDYGMKTVKFAAGIDEAEARFLFEKIVDDRNIRESNLAETRDADSSEPLP